MSSVIINGEPGTQLASSDRAIQYGDGVFETLAWRDRGLEFWPQHMARMQQACKQLKLPVIDPTIWLQDISQLTLGERAVIKLILSRGTGGRGYAFSDKLQPSRLVAAYAWPNYSPQLNTQGIALRRCATPVSMNTALAGIKHLNRLDNVLARNEWQDSAIAEGLMCDIDDNVIEGTMSNLFAVKQSVLYTPLLNRAGVRGVIREQIILIANRLKLSVIERDIKVNELLTMDELFITNSLIGIWPVIKFENAHYAVGKMTQQLQQQLQQDLRTHVTTL